MTKPTGKPRGRPKVSLQDDPDRYRLAFMLAVERSPDVKSSRAAADNLAVLRLERFSTAEVEQHRRPGRVDFDESVRTVGTDAEADRLRKKLHRHRLNPDDDLYLFHLASALIASIGAPTYADAWDDALASCQMVGQENWFIHALAPHIKARFGLT